MSRKLGILIVAAMLSLMLAGCKSVGNNFSLRPVSLIETGKTTQKEVLAMFGNPVRTGMEDGQKTWTYMYYKVSLFAPFEGRDLVIKFDSEGKVSSVSYNTTGAGVPDK